MSPERRVAFFLLIGLVVTPPSIVVAQNGGGGGVWCWSCIEGEWMECLDPYCDEFINHEDQHWFLEGGEGCSGGGANGNGGGDVECSRCGGTSLCHGFPMDGPCHIECGPGGGELALAIVDLEETIRLGDAGGIVRVARSSPSIKLALDSRSVLALPPCGSDEEPIQYPIPEELVGRVSKLLDG